MRDWDCEVGRGDQDGDGKGDEGWMEKGKEVEAEETKRFDRFLDFGFGIRGLEGLGIMCPQKKH